MARSDLLLSLVRNALAGDRTAVERVVSALAAEERAKRHGILADQLSAALTRNYTVPARQTASAAAPDLARGRELVTEVVPKRSIGSLVLPKGVLTACLELVEEHARVELLHSYALEPRNRVLLVGPPGNGKTALAEALAEAMGLPLMIVRYDLLIGSFLGETAARLRRLVEYARTTPCVLFFDEFDAIGKERGDTHETGEIKRVVSSLLMQVDSLPSYVVVVAATNHEELLDRAVWRRFQARMVLPSPTSAQIQGFLKAFFASRGGDLFSQRDIQLISKLMGSPRSFAELEERCMGVLRQVVLRQGSEDSSSTITSTLRAVDAVIKGKGGRDVGTSIAVGSAGTRREKAKRAVKSSPGAKRSGARTSGR